MRPIDLLLRFILGFAGLALAAGLVTGARAQQQRPPLGGVPVPGPSEEPSFGDTALDAIFRAAAAPRTAIINATLDATNGEITGLARIDRARVINSYAPKEFARNQGDWRVTLYCERNCDGSRPRRTPDDQQYDDQLYDDPQYGDQQVYDPQTGAVIRSARPPGSAYDDVAVDDTARRVADYRIVNPLHDIERETTGVSPDAFLFEPVRWSGPYRWELIVPLYDRSGNLPVDRVEVREIRTERLILRAALKRG